MEINTRITHVTNAIVYLKSASKYFRSDILAYQIVCFRCCYRVLKENTVVTRDNTRADRVHLTGRQNKFIQRIFGKHFKQLRDV